MTSLAPIANSDAVRLVLSDTSFIPHRSAFPLAGSTQRLRDEMARFSTPDLHPQRRAEVERVIERLDVARAEALARELTDLELLRGGSVDLIASRVPTTTMAQLLDLSSDDLSLVADVEAVVRVIGRGEPPSVAADWAADRLLELSNDPDLSVAVVSVLYQNFDATGSAVRAADEARRTGGQPGPAVERTRRLATRSSSVDGVVLEPGDEVVLEIAAAGCPYGAGPHECPGRHVAEAIVRGVITALEHDAS